MTEPHPLPPARLVPRDAADHAVIARAHAAGVARVSGRVAVRALRVVGALALCGLPLVAAGLGSASHVRSDYDLEHRLQQIDRMQRSLRQLQHYDLQLPRYGVEIPRISVPRIEAPAIAVPRVELRESAPRLGLPASQPDAPR